MKRFEYLDGLRGLAICGVLLIHVGQSVDGLGGSLANFAAYGFRGVHLFFIVSALTLMTVSHDRLFDARSFYIRRFFRIAPMFYLAIVFYTCLYGFEPRPGVPEGISALDIVLTTFFVHGFKLSSLNSVVPGGWSIASEAIFYALFPFALAFITSLGRAIIAVVLAMGLSVAGHLIFRHGAAPALFDHFGFLSNGSAFACGIALFYLLAKPRPAWLGSGIATVGVIACLAALTLIGVTGMGVLRQELVAIALLSAFAFFAGASESRLIDNPLLSYLGKVSFSVYLVHFAVLHFGENLIDALPGPPAAQFGAAYLLVLGLSVAISTATYNLIELPMIGRGRSLTTKPRELQPA
jgi:exopolysaccharide production protein ExoZ